MNKQIQRIYVPRLLKTTPETPEKVKTRSDENTGHMQIVRPCPVPLQSFQSISQKLLEKLCKKVRTSDTVESRYLEIPGTL